jgi:hypothetical protein
VFKVKITGGGDEAAASSVTVVLNWKEISKQRGSK